VNKKELYIYIDESGTLWSQKNERYFVICALIMDDFQGTSLSTSINRFIKYKYPNIKITELHASQMSFQEKVDFFKYIEDISFKIAYLILDKDNIDSNLFKNNNSLFNYMIFLLLEEYIKNFNTINLYITIDNRNIKITSEKSLEEYLVIECIKNKSYVKNIYIKYDDSRKNNNLQGVDMFANAIYAKYNHGKDNLYLYFEDKITKKFEYIP
jgi:hypothetical protein